MRILISAVAVVMLAGVHGANDERGSPGGTLQSVDLEEI